MARNPKFIFKISIVLISLLWHPMNNWYKHFWLNFLSINNNQIWRLSCKNLTTFYFPQRFIIFYVNYVLEDKKNFEVEFCVSGQMAEPCVRWWNKKKLSLILSFNNDIYYIYKGKVLDLDSFKSCAVYVYHIQSRWT